VLRGDVYELPSPRLTKGREQRGKRFAVVLQANELQALSTTLVAPTSLSARPASFRPEIQIKKWKTKVLVEQLGAVDPRRLGSRVGALTLEEMFQVDEAVEVVLALS